MSMELRREAEQREKERLALKRKELDFARDVRAVSSRPEGRRLLRRLLEDADLFNPAYTPGEAGAYQAGKKAQGLMLWRVARQALSAAAAADLLLPQPGETDPSPDSGREAADDGGVTENSADCAAPF